MENFLAKKKTEKPFTRSENGFIFPVDKEFTDARFCFCFTTYSCTWEAALSVSGKAAKLDPDVDYANAVFFFWRSKNPFYQQKISFTCVGCHLRDVINACSTYTVQHLLASTYYGIFIRVCVLKLFSHPPPLTGRWQAVERVLMCRGSMWQLHSLWTVFLAGA